jgi:hypothetical protein
LQEAKDCLHRLLARRLPSPAAGGLTSRRNPR